MVDVETEGCICANPKCRRKFSKPTHIKHSSGEKSTSYLGCPYCFTKIETDTLECPHYVGYLSERSRGKEIPENCVMCNKSIECMLFKFNKSDRAVEEISKWYKETKE